MGKIADKSKIYMYDECGAVTHDYYKENVTEFFIGDLGVDWFLHREEAEMAYQIKNGSFIRNCGNCEAVNIFKESEPCNSCRRFGNWQLKIW